MAQILQCYDYINKMWEDCQNVWIISDVHFGCQDMQEHFRHCTDEEKIKRINSVCGKTDCLIILGDLGNYHRVKDIRAKTKICLLGNHDTGAKKYKRKIYRKVYDADVYTLDEARANFEKIYLSKYWHISYYEGWDTCHAPFHYYIFTADDKMFDYVFQGVLTIGEKVILSHEHIAVPGMYNLHGHHHSPDWQDTPERMCLCMEKINYTPLNLKKLLTDGRLKNIESLHKQTIEKAKARSAEGVIK